MIRSLPTPLPIALTTTLALLGGCTGVLEDGPAGSAGSDGPGTGGGGSKGDNLDPDSGMPIDEEPEGPFTHAWYTDIGPILIKNCGSCHQPNGSGPFAMTYELAKAWAPLIKSTTAERTMPPMPVNNDGTCQSFDNARWLTDAEIQAIGEWVDEGAPHGPVTDLASFPADLSLSDPNLTVKMPTAYTPAGNVSDDYRCFPVTPNIANDVFLTSYEVVPQSRRIAHHMILYMVPTNDQSWVTTEDAKSATPGYPCFGTIGSPNGDAAQPVAVWAPGGGRIDFPEGTGVRIPKGRMLVIQMHYNLAQGPDTDLTAVKMKVTNSVAHEAFFFPLADTTFKAPPQMELFKTTPNGASDLLSITDGSFNMLAPMTVYGVFPHMHQKGRTLRVTYRSALNLAPEQCLVDVDRWDFRWQEGWWYPKPIYLTGGGLEALDRQLMIQCGYNTMDTNTTTTWGENTSDEMCLNYLYVTSPDLQSLLNVLSGG